MKASHLFAGGGAAGFAALISVWALGKVGVTITTEDGITLGAAALAAGTGLAQRVERYGVKGLLTGLWKGAAAPPPPPAA